MSGVATKVVVLAKGQFEGEHDIDSAFAIDAHLLTAAQKAALKNSRPQDRTTFPGCCSMGFFTFIDHDLEPNNTYGEEQEPPGHLGLYWEYIDIDDELTAYTEVHHCIFYIAYQCG